MKYREVNSRTPSQCYLENDCSKNVGGDRFGRLKNHHFQRIAICAMELPMMKLKEFGRSHSPLSENTMK